MKKLDNFTGLELWRQVIFEIVRHKEDDADLSSRQMAVLLKVYMSDPPHTVKALAAEMNVSKSVISKALDKLSVLDLVKRQTDEKDRRVITLSRTIKGARYVMKLGDIIAEKAQSLLSPAVPETKKENEPTPENKA